MTISSYHGTNTSFKAPDFSKIGDNTGDIVYSNFGFYTTDSKRYAMDYAKYRTSWNGGEPIILKCHIAIDNLYEILESDLAKICNDEQNAIEFKNQLIEEGFDGLKIHTGRAIEYCCFSSEQVRWIQKCR